MENLSVIIPVHNEEESVLTLAYEIEACFRHSSFEWEVIWVNDGSQDRTEQNLSSFISDHSHHQLISLSRQSGQSAAVLTGIEQAKYSLIGTLDGDGQSAPYDLLVLKKLIEKNNVLLAQGVRMQREDSEIRLVSSRIANIVKNFCLGVDLRDVGCAVRVFNKNALNGFPAFKGWHRFLPVMISFLYPGKVIEHPVTHRERLAGVSKYKEWNRLWFGILDIVGILWFKKRGILLPGGLGLQ